MSGGPLVLTGGGGFDYYVLNVQNGGDLHVGLGATEDALTTQGSFHTIYLDGGRDLATYDGQNTLGRIAVKRNFI
jgi:hypothetical protein